MADGVLVGAVSLRATRWVWEHSPARNGARLVHLALADIARCSACKDDRSCDCVEVLALWASNGLVEHLSRLSRAAVKTALRELLDGGLVERVSGGKGTEACSYRLSVPCDADGTPWRFDAASGWGYGAGNGSQADTGPVRPSGVRIEPPVHNGGNGGSESDTRGSDIRARGSESGPYTYTDTEKKANSENGCGQPLTVAEHLAHLRQVLKHG
jgi:hypothetical protein